LPEARKVWVSVLDDRTTLICLDAHGQAVPLGEPFDTIAGAVEGPPAHWNCRSLIDIETVNLSDLTRPNVRGNRYVASERRKGRARLRAEQKRLGPDRYQRQKAREARTIVPKLVEYIAPET